MVNAYYEELDPYSLTVDDERGGYLQTEHLIKQDHKDIVGFFKEDDLQGIRRMKGFIKAHRDYGITLNHKNIVTYDSNNTKVKTKEYLADILSRDQKPTGLVSYNDQIALYLLDVIREKNLKVPEDISLVGFDDSFLAELSEVKLTTVTHPQNVMGMKSAEMILRLANQKLNNTKSEDVKSIVYEPKLIIRESTGTCPNVIKK